MQSNKKIDPIKLDKDIMSKEIKILGLYDPVEYGLSMDMWLNSDGAKLVLGAPANDDNYSGTTITDKRALPGMEQPFYYWIPSIAPSGMTFLTSNKYKDWKNSLFIGSLKFEYLERLVIKNNKIIYNVWIFRII